MRSNDRESFREGQASNHPNELSSSPAAMNLSARAPQLWIQATEAIMDWYGAMFRLAFGLGRVTGHRETLSAVMPQNSPPIEHPQPGTAAAPPSPVTLVHSQPAAPVQVRPKRRNSPSKANNRSRSSKASRVKRSRRAA
jgi:hypothetical protein